MTDALKELADTLAVDGYELTVASSDDRALVSVSAADGICGDCLVPKTVMKGFLVAALGLDESQIDLRYPDEVAAG